MATPNVTPNVPTTPLPTGGTIPFLDPSGTPRMIPADQEAAATQAGGKRAVKMLDPSGTPRWIPADQQDAAVAAGGKPADAVPPQDAPSAWQRAKDNIESNLQPAGGTADAVVGGISRGFAKGGMQTLGGLLDIYRKLGKDDGPELQAASDWFKKNSQTEGFWEGVGGTGESLAEMLGTEGVGSLVSDAARGTEAGGKVLSVADKLKNSQQVAAVLKNEKIAKLAALGMRALHSAALAGGQAYVKSGGDTSSALEGAALGAGGSAAVEGIGAAAGGAKKAAMGALERLARPSETVDAVGNTARDIVEQELNRTNAIRGPQPTTGMPEGGFKSAAGDGGAQASSSPQLAAGSNELPASATPEGETTALARTDGLAKEPAGGTVEQPATATAVPKTPKFGPVDVQKAVSETGSFADAMERLHEVARPVYDHLNKITNGEWQTDWDNMRATDAARSKLSRGVDDDEIARLTGRYNALSAKVYGAFDKAAMNPEDANQAIRNFHTGFVLDRAHRAIQSIYDIEAARPLRSGTYQGIGTSRVGEQWRQFIKDTPHARDIIGSDRADTLQRLFDLNETRASRRQLAAGVYSLAKLVMPGGGIAGKVADKAIRHAVGGLVADPRAAKSLMFAIDSGAKPENYAPGIAKMMLRRVGRAAIPAAASSLATGSQQ